MGNKEVHKNLHVAYGNNGLSIWEDGDKNFTAFITTSRELKINNLKSFSSENFATIKELQAKGNVIVMVSPGTSKVILDPINSPTKYHINQKTGERFDISVERVNGKEYAVSNKYIFPKEPSFYPDIERNSSLNTDESLYINVDISVTKDELCAICKNKGYEIEPRDLADIPTDNQGHVENNYLKIDKNQNVDWFDEYEFRDSALNEEIEKTISLKTLKLNTSNSQYAVGKINYLASNGDIAETVEFTDKKTFLKAIKRELDFNSNRFEEKILVNDNQLINDVNKLYAGISEIEHIIDNENGKNIIGRINYYSPNGRAERIQDFTEKDTYLKAIKDALNVNPDGFQAKTIARDVQLDNEVTKLYNEYLGINNTTINENGKNIIGKIEYYENGRVTAVKEYTDKKAYLEAISAQLHFNPHDFKETTILKDEEFRKDVAKVFENAYTIPDDYYAKKYELLEDDTKEFEGKKLYRIKACKDFGDVKAGDLGGYVETENNLDQHGKCWIYDNSIVKDIAAVQDNAIIKGNSIIKENAFIMNNTIIQNKSIIKGDSLVKGNAIVTNAKIFDKAILENNANIHDDFIVGNTRVSDANFVNKKEMYGNERQQLEIIDSDNAVIHENGKTWNANDVMTGIKDHGVNPDDISKAQLNKLAVGQKVQLPGAKGNTQFSLLKKAGGYGLQTFSMTKQINSALEQSM